jgi:hypothetical protein
MRFVEKFQANFEVDFITYLSQRYSFWVYRLVNDSFLQGITNLILPCFLGI